LVMLNNLVKLLLLLVTKYKNNISKLGSHLGLCCPVFYIKIAAKPKRTITTAD